MRVLNFGFFHLDSVYIQALRELDIIDKLAFEDIRTRTYLPMIDNMSPPAVVFSLVKTSFSLVLPTSEDIIIVSGISDVVCYITALARETGSRIICPLGRFDQGRFNLMGFREVLTDVVLDEASLGDALFHLCKKGSS